MTLTAVLFLGGLYPFQLQFPQHRANSARIVDGHSVEFQSPGIARVRTDWLPLALVHEEFSLKLRFQSYKTHQRGPARIFTNSHGAYLRNVQIGQHGTDLLVRIYPKWDHAKTFCLRDTFLELGWHELFVELDRSSLTMKLDKAVTQSHMLNNRPILSWNSGYGCALGNELQNGQRPWLGVISEAIVTVNGREFDCLELESLQIPDTYVVRKNVQWTRFDLVDAILNFVFFVPLGFFLVASFENRFANVLAVMTCAVSSFLLEFVQLSFALRATSIIDWCLNVGGAVLGSVLASFLLEKRSVPT